MFRSFPKIWSQVLSPTNNDKVLFAQPLPSGSVMHSMSMNISLIAEAAIARTSSVMYGLHAYVLPVLDPDAGTTPDVIWDTQVPKDKALSENMLDLDTGTADTDALTEPGLVNAEGMLNVGKAPVQVFAREKFITWADQKGGYDRTADDFLPTDKIVGRINKPIYVAEPSYFLMAISSPLTTLTSTTWNVINEDSEWTQLQYMEYTLEDAWKAIVGLTEAADDDPYVDAMENIGKWLETMHEETAGAWLPTTWRAFGKASFDISVPGSLDQVSLSSSPD